MEILLVALLAVVGFILGWGLWVAFIAVGSWIMLLLGK